MFAYHILIPRMATAYAGYKCESGTVRSRTGQSNGTGYRDAVADTLCFPQMHSHIRGLGRVMVFLAAALASASLTIPEGWGEEGKQNGVPVAWGHWDILKMGKDQEV